MKIQAGRLYVHRHTCKTLWVTRVFKKGSYKCVEYEYLQAPGNLHWLYLRNALNELAEMSC